MRIDLVAGLALATVFSCAFVGRGEPVDAKVSLGARYTILVEGLDRDPLSANRDRRSDLHTDTLVLLTSQIGSGVVSALHVPRDTRVFVPGNGWMKINQVLMSSGQNELRQQLTHLTGLKVCATLQLDFERFRQVMRTIGPISFAVDRAIASPEGDAFVPPGRRKLSASEALAVVRFRHEALGDIGRVHRQERFLRQAVLVASRLSMPMFARAMRLADPGVPDAVVGRAYALIHPLVRYEARSVPGNFSVSGVSYWLADQEAMRQITAQILSPTSAQSVFAQRIRARAYADVDDGHDRSR